MFAFSLLHASTNIFMNPAVEITIASTKDVAAIAALVNSAYRGEPAKKGWTTEADLLDGLRTNDDSLTGMINTPGSVILKYTDNTGQLLGCVYLNKKENKLYLGMLTVAPALQAKGIGKQLLLAAEKHAKEVGCAAITMTVISVRKELIAWYERHGYQSTGETKPFPVDPAFGLPKQPLHFIVMEKMLCNY